MENIQHHKQYLFLSIIIIAIGVSLTTLMTDRDSAIGIVIIAIGGLFFILALTRKRDEQKKNKF